MKQTNNAIKFLMAQYRAIFKHAYLKGLASAIVLTSVLASGAANAATNADGILNADDFVNGADISSLSGDTVTQASNINLGDWNTDQFSGSSSFAAYATATKLSGSGAQVQITGAANKHLAFTTLTIENGASLSLTNSSGTNTHIYGFTSGNASNGTSGTLTVNQASLTLSSASVGFNKVEIKSGSTITLGGQINLDKNNASNNGEWWSSYTNIGALPNTTASGELTVDSSTVNLNDKSNLNVSSGSTMTIKGTSTINFNGTLHEVSSGDGYATAFLRADQTTTPGTITISGSSDTKKVTLNVADEAYGAIYTNELNISDTDINIGSGATMILDGDWGANTLADEGSHSGSAITLSGDVTVNNATGTLIIGNATSGSTITVASSGTTVINGKLVNHAAITVEDAATLAVDAAQLEKDTDKTIGLFATNGGVILKSGSTFQVQDTSATNVVDLADYNISGSGSIASTEDFTISGTATITGDYLAVTNQLQNSSDSSANVDGTSGTLSIEAVNLTLGSTDFDGSTALGFYKATTKNVKFVAATGADSFILQDDVTLRSITSGDGSINVGTNGQIEGDVTVSDSKTLTVDGGLYTANDAITLKSGSLVVTNTKNADVSKLTIAGEFTIDNTTANNITVSGSSADYASTLDISAADLEVINKGKTFSTIKVSGTGATLITNGNNLEKLMAQDSANSISGSALFVNAGTVQVTDSVDLNSDRLVSGNAASSGNISFSGSGSLEVAGTLTLSGTTNAIAIGSGQIEAQKLVLNAGSATTTTINSGIFTVTQELSTKTYTDTLELAGAGATLNLGKIESGAAVGGGKVNTALDLGTGAKVEVIGAWSTDKLTTAAGSDVTVNALGSLTLNGTADTEGSEVSGLSLAADTINVAGQLTLGANVAENIVVSDAETPAVTADGIVQGAIALSGGTVTINFSSGNTFDGDQLNALKSYLFSGSTGNIDGILNIGDAKIAGVELGTADANGRYDYSNVAAVSDVAGNNVTNNDLANNTFTTTDGTNVAGTVGSLHITGASAATFNNSVSLVNANTEANNGLFVSVEGSDGKDVAADITFNGSVLRLENGGEAGNITVTKQDGTLLVKSTTDAQTVLGDVTASHGTFDVQGSTTAQKVEVENLNLIEGVTLEADSVKVTTTDAVTLDGALKVTSGSAEFTNAASVELTSFASVAKNVKTAGDLVLTAGAQVGKDMIVGGDLAIAANTDVSSGDTVVTDDTTVSNNATFVTDTFTVKNGNIYIGQDGENGSSAVMQSNLVDLNGQNMIVDPNYGEAASIAIVGAFQQTPSDPTITGGVLNGKVVAAQNGIAVLGYENATEASALAEVKATFSSLLNSQGSLSRENIGAIVYVGKPLEVADGSKLIADGTVTGNTIETGLSDPNSAYATYDAYIGSNSAIAIDENALNDLQGAIHFNTATAKLYNAGGKVLLVGDSFSTLDSINLFTDNGAVNETNGVLIEGKDLVAETLNGLFSLTYKAGQETTAQKLSLNLDQVPYIFNDASAPVKNSLIAYASRDNNWAEQGQDGYTLDRVHGALAAGITYDGTDFKKNGQTLTATEEKNYVAIEYTKEDGTKAYNVYNAAYNEFLDSIVRNSTSGRAAEQAARMSTYGGTAQVALSAGATTYEAISGRMGVGAQYGSITYADNGQGAGLWVTPVYKNHDSDGFGAQGLSYGVDMDLYGVALGGDFTLANGLRVGAAFNVGSGDADGQGAGAGVSNDFDYYGFSVYGGFTYDKLSIVGDISYTVVDNDVEASTAVDKLHGSMDSSNLSVSVTGQYALSFNGMDITPHAALRYTYVDMDDYEVKGDNYGSVAQYAGDSFSVFSIPVGVTFSKDIAMGDWTVKPAFDLTLTANMGDDSVDGTVTWSGIENMHTNVEAEVIDSFTYGATLGVAAKTGNLSLGFGINYTGASSADEFGVGANARFVF